MSQHLIGDPMRSEVENAAPERGSAVSAARTAGSGAVARVHSRELLRRGGQLIIEHAGREYRLRVTSKGKLILTA
jgi:hemin uptake protein HemP